MNEHFCPDHYPILTICGSTKFKDEIIALDKQYTLDEYIVLSPGVYPHSDGEQITTATKAMLDDMQFRKIAMSEKVVVVDPGGYIGTSTASQIIYAYSCRKPVHYTDNLGLNFNNAFMDWMKSKGLDIYDNGSEVRCIGYDGKDKWEFTYLLDD